MVSMVTGTILTVDPQETTTDTTGGAAQDDEPVAAPLPPAGVNDEPVLHPDIETFVAMVEENEELTLPVTVEMALAHIENGDHKAALELLDGVVGEMTTADRLPAIRQETGHELLAFRNPFEAALHFHITGRQYISVAFPEALFGAFCVYGWLLVEAGRHDEAARSLETAILLNPMNCEPLLELSEVCKMRGDLDGFLMHTMKALGIAYTGADLGRCYRNYGYFEIERGNYALASALFWHSLSFDPDSGMAWNELAYIRQQTGKPLVEPPLDEVKALLAANGIPLGASADVTTVAASLAQDSLANGQYETATLCCSILSDVTPREVVAAATGKP